MAASPIAYIANVKKQLNFLLMEINSFTSIYSGVSNICIMMRIGIMLIALELNKDVENVTFEYKSNKI